MGDWHIFQDRYNCDGLPLLQLTHSQWASGHLGPHHRPWPAQGSWYHQVQASRANPTSIFSTRKSRAMRKSSTSPQIVSQEMSCNHFGNQPSRLKWPIRMSTRPIPWTAFPPPLSPKEGDIKQARLAFYSSAPTRAS